MEQNILKALEKIILPVSQGWSISEIEINDKKSEVYVELSFKDQSCLLNGKQYKIYDYRPMRKWRHLDLWQYKTYIKASVPRIKTPEGIISMEVPWADNFSRISGLFEKK